MNPDLPAAALDRPLPEALTGSGHSWFTEYRRWPVFSRGWARLRWRLAGPAAALFMAVTGLSAFAGGGPDTPWGGLLQLTMNLLVPLAAGPWLALQVRRRGLPAQAEWLALWGALGAVVVAVAAFNLLAAEPMKQWVAEQAGQVDAEGQRKRVLLSIGVWVTPTDKPIPQTAPGGGPAPPDGTAHAASAPAANGPGTKDGTTHIASTAAMALLTFWLAGGAGLWGWRRERAGLARLAHDRELAEAQAARREAELRLSVLAAQVEPHFLFNTLAGVRSAIVSDPARASRLVDRLVDYLRATIPRMRSDGEAESTVGAQFAAVRAYLALMAERIPRLAFDVKAPVELQGARCPPLMLISLAENAVKHGVEPKLGPARIDVTARRRDDGCLELIVADDGVGFGGDTAGGGLGLVNVRERLRQLHGDAAALVLKARPEGGVSAVLTLPPEDAR